MVRVAILVYGFPPKWQAGTELATCYIARELQSRGHEVHVITARDRGVGREDQYRGIPVYRLFWPNLSVLGKVGTLLARAQFQLHAVLAIRRIEPQVVHAQSFYITPCCLLVKRILKKPYIAAGRGSDVYGLDLLPRPYARFLRAIFEKSVKCANAVTALTEDMKSRIQKDYGRDAVVIPNGIDLEKRTPLISKENARKSFGLNSDAKIVVSVANLWPVKGVEHLIRAVKRVRETEPNIQLLVIGAGSEETKLKDLVTELNLRKHVWFVGSVPNDQVPEYLVASDVFVLPSLSEGFSNALLEAMAAALPIVASNVGGNASIVEDGINGFLVEPGSPTQIADKVLEILREPQTRHLMSEANRRMVGQYTWQKVAGDFEQLYLECLPGFVPV